MKRAELEAGKEYAYQEGKYGGTRKVRVIDTEPVRRNRGYNKDGVRVVFPDDPEHLKMYTTSKAQYDRALEHQDTAWGRAVIRSYDGFTDDGEMIVRVLPRRIASTWLEHLEQEAADMAEERRLSEMRRVARARRNAAYAKLPARYQEVIKNYNGEYGRMSGDDVDKLVTLLIEDGVA